MFLISWLVKRWCHDISWFKKQGRRCLSLRMFLVNSTTICYSSAKLDREEARNRATHVSSLSMWLQICKANDRWREGSACTANESLQLKVDILKPVSLCWFLRACCSQRCGDVAKTAHRSEVDAKKHERQKSDWNDWKGYHYINNVSNIGLKFSLCSVPFSKVCRYRFKRKSACVYPRSAFLHICTHVILVLTLKIPLALVPCRAV